LKTTSSSLNIKIHSTAYWGWGLLTSGYLNVITLEGPLNERARLVLDMTSSLGQSPWEMAHLNSAEKWLKRHEPSLSLKHNEQIWKALRQAARSNLKEAIERMKEQIDTVWSEGIDDADEWRSIIDDDLHMARQALAEDNATLKRTTSKHQYPCYPMVATGYRARRRSPSKRLILPGLFPLKTMSHSLT
jgi:hypothetical protein